MTTPDDDLRSQLHGAANSIDPGDLSLEGIRATARRRGRLSRAGAVVGVLGLVSAGVVAFVAAGGPDDPGTLRSADPSTPESTQAPESSVADTTVTTLPESTTPSVTVEVVQRPGVTGQPVGVGGAPDYGEWTVPWGDGFLVGAQEFAAQPLPDELPDEVVALFPPEVVELFDGELPPTIDEAIAMLSDAGLLDVVEEIILENPEAYEAVYSVPSVDEPPTLDVRYTTDGVAWEPVEMTLPPGASYPTNVTSVGDRLVLAYSTVDPMTGLNADGVVRVASSVDLVDWDVQEVVTPPPPVSFPSGVHWSADVAGFAANESGWAMSVYSGVNVNPEALLDAELQASLADGGYGYGLNIDEAGITVELSGPATVTTTAGSVPAGTDPELDATVSSSDSEVVETTTYTWEELGIAPDVAAYLGDQEYEPVVWSSNWGETPTPGGVDTGFGQLVATSTGFMRAADGLEFSPDGITWTPSELVLEDAFVSGAFAFDGGAVVVVFDYLGRGQVFRVDENGGSPVLLDVPGLPESFQSGYSNTTRNALLIDASEPPPPPPPLVVEYDGHRLTADFSTGALEIVDMATGAVVGEADLSEYGSEPEGNVAIGDDGVTVTDSATGGLIVAFPIEALTAAEDESSDESEYDDAPDMRLLASRDGERFLLVDLDDDEYGFGSIASNDTKVLVQVDEEWAVYDLP
jgi:hypothetical protein